jgi:hypothetical protein
LGKIQTGTRCELMYMSMLDDWVGERIGVLEAGGSRYDKGTLLEHNSRGVLVSLLISK